MRLGKTNISVQNYFNSAAIIHTAGRKGDNGTSDDYKQNKVLKS